MTWFPAGCSVLTVSCLFFFVVVVVEKLLSFSNIMLWSKWHCLALRRAHYKGLMLEFTVKCSPVTIFLIRKVLSPDPLFNSFPF